jgi:hypothetical protein
MDENLVFESLKGLYRTCFRRALQNNLARTVGDFRQRRKEELDQDVGFEFEIPEISAYEETRIEDRQTNERQIVLDTLNREMIKLGEFSVTTPNSEICDDSERLWKLIQLYKRAYDGQIPQDHLKFIEYVERELDDYIRVN